MRRPGGVDERVRAEGVSRFFCRDLKRSLLYGIGDVAREVVGLRTRETLRPGEFLALDDVSFRLGRGEALAVIGRNGAGKSTLLKILSGLIKPSRGRVTVRGKVGALIELGAGFNPVLTGRENIYVNAAVLGMPRRQADRILDEIVEFAELEEFINTPVQSYSSGMRVRLGYAIAAHLEPDLLIADEVLAVGDYAFQRKCLEHMRRYVEGGGSLILVSHNMHLIQSVCGRGLLLDRGRLVHAGPVGEAVQAYFELGERLPPGGGAGGRAERTPSDEPLVIEGVRFEPLDGGAVRAGAPLRVTMHYRARAAVDDVVWAFSIFTGDQWVRIATFASSREGVRFDLPAGEGALSCVVPTLPLVSGTYVVKGGIHHAETLWPIARLGYDGPPAYLRMAPSGDGEVENRRRTNSELLVLDAVWEPARRIAART